MLYIVDDDIEFSLLLRDISSPHVPALEVFHEPISFFDKIELTSADIVILDIKMPKMDGIEVLRELAGKLVSSSLILISGVESGVLNSTAMLAKELGLNIAAQLPKPFPPQKLVDVLTNIISDDEVKSFKHTGHNGGEVYSFSKAEIEDGLSKGQITLFYQPQIDLNTRQLCSVEGLVRWNHPTLGLIPPNHFLPLVNKHRLLDALTDHVIECAINAESVWNKLGIEINTSINVNASNVINLSLPEKLETLANNAEITPSKICLEVTESELMTELIPSMDTLTRLRLKGFRLSIDDFGTGFSSLLQLYRIPFTELKIDRSFIKNLATNSESRIIVETCILLAHKLGMKVVAEGIEDRETFTILHELGCDIGQGYYFSKPLPEHELHVWLHENKKRALVVL